MFKYLKLAKKFVVNPLSYLYEGYCYDLTFPYLQSLGFFFKKNCSNFYRDLHLSKPKEPEFLRLQKRVKGLHALFGKDLRFSYSILVPLESSSPTYLKECLLSCCNQTALNFEIIVGANTVLSKPSQKIIEDIQKEHSNVIFYDFSTEDKNIPLLNLMAEKAHKNFMLIVDATDWIRPDLLFRYEQLLRSFERPETVVVTSNENVINKRGIALPNSEKQKSIPIFPYLFQEAFPLRGVLIPSILWKRLKGLRQEFSGAVKEDLLLRLDLEGVVFSNIPIALYSCLRGAKDELKFNKVSLKRAMEEYSFKKGLDWKFSLGDYPCSIEAIPKADLTHKIHVIVPFKDLKEMTLRSIELVLKQKNVSLSVTAIDNNSEDKSVAVAIRQMGCEVLHIDEPFNYSRLNNLAVEKSEVGKTCDLLLFLNNDVELENNALMEMLRWIDQPKIGAVGACLLYPNGTIQHGGIDCLPYKYEEMIHYNLVDYMQRVLPSNRSSSVSIVDSVTGACLLVKKDLFLKVGGFNEIWFPVAYSDVELTKRIEDYGFKCLYTPHAKGIHHESISRKVVLEDVENSRWLHDLVASHAKAKRSLRL